MRPPILPLAALFLLSAVPLTAGNTNMVGPVWEDFAGLGTGESLDWGDIDGDGYYDVVVGAPGTHRTFLAEGVLWIYYGRPNDVPTGFANWEWSSGVQSGTVGKRMATCDFNGDGYDDIVSYGIRASGTSGSIRRSTSARRQYGKRYPSRRIRKWLRPGVRPRRGLRA